MKRPRAFAWLFFRNLAAHTGLEPVISALRGQRVNQLHQCAADDFGIIDVELIATQGRIDFTGLENQRDVVGRPAS